MYQFIGICLTNHTLEYEKHCVIFAKFNIYNKNFPLFMIASDAINFVTFYFCSNTLYFFVLCLPIFAITIGSIYISIRISLIYKNIFVFLCLLVTRPISSARSCVLTLFTFKICLIIFAVKCIFCSISIRMEPVCFPFEVIIIFVYFLNCIAFA